MKKSNSVAGIVLLDGIEHVRLSDGNTLEEDERIGMCYEAINAAVSRLVEAERNDAKVEASLERDRVWCAVICNTVDIKTVESVMREFNRIRPDQDSALADRVGEK